MKTRSKLPLMGLLLLIPGVFLGWVWWMRSGALFVAKSVAIQVPSPPASGVGFSELGQAGDMFGGLSALFSALAFVGVAIAAFYQKVAADLQAEQLVDAQTATRQAEGEAVFARKIAARQLERAEDQHARESFEPLFFLLLSNRPPLPLTLKRPPQMPVTPDGSILAGPHPSEFDPPEMAERLRGQIVTSKAYADARMKNLGGIPSLIDFYLNVYRANEITLGPYWRSLYHVFKLIDRAKVEFSLKVEYANIARARLSTTEIFFLTLNCAASVGSEFKPLVDRYGLLKHVHRTGDPLLPSPDEELAAWCYAPTAVMSAESRCKYWDVNPAEDPRRLPAE
jgi:hypothetical protein